MRNELSATFGGMMNGEATVRVRRVKGDKVAVVAYVPPGIDLYPIVYGRFDSTEAAMETYYRACREAAKMVGEVLCAGDCDGECSDCRARAN
jgi:hypothetical protein